MAEVRNGQDTAKKKAYSLREGKAREGNVSGSMASGVGEMREDTTGWHSLGGNREGRGYVRWRGNGNGRSCDGCDFQAVRERGERT